MIKYLLLLVLLVFSALNFGCAVAQGNMQTLISDDCGVTWKMVKQGQSIPSRVSVCAYKVTIPDYPMQGDAKFRSNFKGNVKATVDLSYSYRITDGLKFITEAKYIGSDSGDSKAQANDDRFEGAENVVIGKQIRDVQRELLANEDIVDFDANEFETKLVPLVNERLESRGVKIEYLSFVPDPDEQTAQAIDVATSLRIYANNNIPLDKALEIIKARAGAPKIAYSTQEVKEAKKN